jgi:alpha-glucosidase
LQDPEAIANWPLTLRRDGTRTPMPWAADAEHCGFSIAEPWLPLGPDHTAMAVDAQEADPASMLALTRMLIALRNANEAMLIGDLRIIEARGGLLVFERRCANQHLVCAFNMGGTPAEWHPAQPDRWHVVKSVNDASTGLLPAYGATIMEKIA